MKDFTLLMNSDPLSVMTASGNPYVVKMWIKANATPDASFDFKGIAIGHFEKRSVHVRMYLFPLGVSCNGPTKSIPIISQVLQV